MVASCSWDNDFYYHWSREPHAYTVVGLFTVSQQKRIKRKHDDSISADSPSSRNPKMQRSNSAAPMEALQIHSEVAYRLPKQKNAEGEWIQCTITAILGGEGLKRK
jgi:SAGA-associated factor 29